METIASELKSVCITALEQNKYVYIIHKGRGRNIYPFSFQYNRSGKTKLYAWCELHYYNDVEQFLLENISDFRVSSDPIDRVFTEPSQFR